MTALDRLIPAPRLLEVDHVDLSATPSTVWDVVRHCDLGRSAVIRALFALRTLPDRHAHPHTDPLSLHLDDLTSSPGKPGFRVLIDEPPREVALGAIGKVWEPSIPLVHCDTVEDFAGFSTPDHAKVAWAIRVLPRGERDARVEVELRVDATDEEAWQKFRRYFRLVGMASRFIRHSVLSGLAHELGVPEARENERALDGDELLPDAREQDTRGVTLSASPAAIWPWLVQMGCHRGGFYSLDLLDNGGQRSAREVHPELQRLSVGDVLPATPDGNDGFEVLRLEPNRCLVIGGLFDPETKQHLPFALARPRRFWQVTWSFVLEPLDDDTTRLHVRVRAAFPDGERLHATWMRFAHRLMETAQLRHLAARVEDRLPHDDWREVIAGVGGAAIIVAAFLTGFLRRARNHWGVSTAIAAMPHPGDELVLEPRWSWTHGIDIDAPAEVVWSWVAQVGADRAGFYSYQWLENIAGCDLQNAERIHPEMELSEGEELRLHPKMPPLRVVQLERGRYLVAHGAADEKARAAGKPWATVSWLFLVEPLGASRCRLISRFRSKSSADLVSLIQYAPVLIEPIGFAMDRRMLLGVKERAERRAPPQLRHFEAAQR